MPDPTLWFTLVNGPSAAEAERIGRALLSAGHVKSVNISAEMKTVYLWEGRLVETREVQLIVKLPAAERAAAEALVTALHPFEVPAIVSWAALPSADYGAYCLA